MHTWNVFDTVPPSHIAIFGSVQYTAAAAHRSLLEFELMSSTPPHVGLSLPLTDFNFGADFCDFGGDFGASFGFDADFGAVFSNFADFFGGPVTSDFEVDLGHVDVLVFHVDVSIEEHINFFAYLRSAYRAQ